MTGLIIAIKDNGLLAESSLHVAAPICVLHVRMCRKVPLVRLGLTLSITPGHFGSLIISECLFMQVSISKCMFSISKVTTDSLNCVMNDAI